VAGDDDSRYFSAALTLSIALLALANLVVFPALVRLRRSQPDRARPFRVPGGPAGALAATALATGWSAVALAAALWPGLGTADPDVHLPDGFAGDRLGFILAELVPLTAVLVAPSLLVRRRHRALARAAEEFLGRGDAHFSIPGHKRNPALVGDHPALLADMPQLCGVDDLRGSRDLLGQAQRLAAQAWRADRTWFSVSGSTMANQAMCLAAGAPGDQVVARTSHRSVLAGLVLAGLDPIWVRPDVDPAAGLALAVPPGRVERALAAHPEAKAVLLVEPSYLGVARTWPRSPGSPTGTGRPCCATRPGGTLRLLSGPARLRRRRRRRPGRAERPQDPDRLLPGGAAARRRPRARRPRPPRRRYRGPADHRRRPPVGRPADRGPAPVAGPAGRDGHLPGGRRHLLADRAPAGPQPPRRLLRPPRAGPGRSGRRPGHGRDRLPYPPGIPALVPGELVTAGLLDALRSEARAGTRMAGAADPTLDTLLVVRA